MLNLQLVRHVSYYLTKFSYQLASLAKFNLLMGPVILSGTSIGN